MKVSVVSTAFRPGGIDVLLAGMRDQTFTDFEVILVDRRYELRHQAVKAMADEYSVNLIHVPEHRRNGKWISFCSAFNTGLAVARGEIVIFLADWMYAPPGWIERHIAALDNENRYVSGAYKFLALPPLKLKKPYDFEAIEAAWKNTFMCIETNEVALGAVLDDMDVFTAGRFDPAWIPDLAAKTTTVDLRTQLRGENGGGLGEGWLHIKNDSVRRETLLGLNGFDERLERGRGPLDMDIQMRLETAGTGLFWNLDCWVYYMDPHLILPTLPYGAVNERLEGRWCWLDGLEYVTKRRKQIAQGESSRARNPYDIRDLAETLESWRNGAEKIVRDVDDKIYWGEVIWPDSP